VGESQGNRSKNASVTVNLDVGVVVKGYDVRIDIPKQVIVNRSYEGRITLFLENNVRVMVDAISDPSLLIVPSSMVLDIDGKFGSANFTLIATEPSGYAIVFRMVDTNGVPFPPEVVYLEAVEPSGLAVITSADPRYMAVASLLSGNNTTSGRPERFAIWYDLKTSISLGPETTTAVWLDHILSARIQEVSARSEPAILETLKPDSSDSILLLTSDSLPSMITSL